jgi:nucleotide-binding universal stress UspA family protein
MSDPDASGPVVIAYDGSTAADVALSAAGRRLRTRRALVVVVWQPGIPFELIELPTSTVGLPPVQIDWGRAVAMDRELADKMELLAQRGAGLARAAGFEEAEGRVVADEGDPPAGETIVRVAGDVDADVVAMGTHDYGRLSEIILGSTSRYVMVHAPCPVLFAHAD